MRLSLGSLNGAQGTLDSFLRKIRSPVSFSNLDILSAQHAYSSVFILRKSGALCAKLQTQSTFLNLIVLSDAY